MSGYAWCWLLLCNTESMTTDWATVVLWLTAGGGWRHNCWLRCAGVWIQLCQPDWSGSTGHQYLPYSSAQWRHQTTFCLTGQLSKTSLNYLEICLVLSHLIWSFKKFFAFLKIKFAGLAAVIGIDGDQVWAGRAVTGWRSLLLTPPQSRPGLAQFNLTLLSLSFAPNRFLGQTEKWNQVFFFSFQYFALEQHLWNDFISKNKL